MEQWQERVIQEKKELDEKIDKLKKFLDEKVEKGFNVEETEKLRLEVQLTIMESYSNILHARILSWSQTSAT